MISNLQPNTTYAVHLRASSVSGGKDWVGSVTANNEVHTYWGRTNQIAQHAAKPGDLSVLRKIISQKMQGKDKYSAVDEYDPQQGWLSQRKQPPIPKPNAPQQPALAVDWVEAPNAAINWDF